MKFFRSLKGTQLKIIGGRGKGESNLGITESLSFSYGLKGTRNQACKESEGKGEKSVHEPEARLAGLRH